MKSRIEKLGLLVMEAERRLRRQFEAQTATHGLSAAQWRLLGHLLREGPSTQVALADLLDVEPISVSRLIDRMEQAGWVHRDVHPDDRRARIIDATDKARAVAPGVRDIADDISARALAGLTDAECQIFEKALRHVIAQADRQTARPGTIRDGAPQSEIETLK